MRRFPELLAGCLHWAVERELVRKALGRGCAKGHGTFRGRKEIWGSWEAHARAVVDCWGDERCVSEMHPSLPEHRPQDMTNQESPPSPHEALWGQFPERSPKSQLQG